MSTDNQYSWIDPDEEIRPYLEDMEEDLDASAPDIPASPDSGDEDRRLMDDEEDGHDLPGDLESADDSGPTVEKPAENIGSARSPRQEDHLRRQISAKPARQVEPYWTIKAESEEDEEDEVYAEEDTEKYDPDYDILAPGQPVDQPPYNVPFQPGDVTHANPPGKRPDRPLTAAGEAPPAAEAAGQDDPLENTPTEGEGTPAAREIMDPAESVQPAPPEDPLPVDAPASPTLPEQSPAVGEAEPPEDAPRRNPPPGPAPEALGYPTPTKPRSSSPADIHPPEPDLPESLQEPAPEQTPAEAPPSPGSVSTESSQPEETDMVQKFQESQQSAGNTPEVREIPLPQGRTPEEKLNVLAEWLLENLDVEQVFVIDVEGHTVAAREVTRPVLSAGSQLFAAWAHLAANTGCSCGKILRSQLDGPYTELAILCSGEEEARGILGLGLLCRTDFPRPLLQKIQGVFAEVCEEITGS